MSGKVWLVGAGPGDPELLTLKAVRALQDADVVMVDDLVNPSILQDFIQRLMLRHARQGRSVVRLKGGDPCIFGRAGEEAEWLARHGIDSEIVNGITAGLAGATACGIPLTYRGISRGVTLVTAHTQDDSPLAWEALARSGTTLVVYMGVARLAEIQAGLLAGGMAEDTPLAMIENATLGNQRECRSNLGELLRDAGRFALKPISLSA